MTGNTYLDVLRSSKLRNVEIKSSPRREALKLQKNKCAKCKRDLNPSFMKFIKSPEGKDQAICSDCAVNSFKKR